MEERGKGLEAGAAHGGRASHGGEGREAMSSGVFSHMTSSISLDLACGGST